MEQKYRLLYLVIGVMAVLSFMFIEKNIGIAAFTEEIFLEGCLNVAVPGVAYYKEPQELKEDTMLDELVKTAMPVSAMIKYNDDYLKLAENVCDSDIKTDTGIVSENVNESTEDKKENETTKDNTLAQTNNSSETASVGGDVISRSSITGTVYNRADLENYDFVHKHFYTITSITDLTNSILRPAEFINKDLSIDKGTNEPQILIFHTHSQEGFTDTIEGDTSTTIIGVGDYLTDLLVNKYGYNVIHDKSVYDYVDGKLDRSKAYTYAENGIAAILNENPSIQVVIDLHRDGVADTTHLLTNIDGKNMAKIMFFNGLSYSKVNGEISYLNNPYRDDNLAMSLQMQLIGEAYYPGFLRNIYVNAYRYCLHERARSMLIEAGAQTNSVQEVKNAMEPLADILDKFLSGQKVIGE